MKHPSAICQPTQTELRRILAKNIRDYVANWYDTNFLRRVSLEDAILQGIDSSLDEYEEYEGQRMAENRHNYLLTRKDAPEPYDPSEQDRHEDALTQIEQHACREALEKLHNEAMALPVSDPEKFVRCAWCTNEMPRPKEGQAVICDNCIPF